LYLRATSGSRRSAERRVAVSLPAFIADLQLTARFPAYLERPDEQLVPGSDTVPVPAGTALVTTGATSVALAGAAWVPAAGAPLRLAVSGTRFGGRFVPARSGVWRLDVAPTDGSPLEGASAELALRLPTLAELRAAARADVRNLGAAGDSLAAAAADLSRRTGDLAHERPREGSAGGRRAAGAQAGALPFETSQRAAAIAQQ